MADKMNIVFIIIIILLSQVLLRLRVFFVYATSKCGNSNDFQSLTSQKVDTFFFHPILNINPRFDSHGIYVFCISTTFLNMPCCPSLIAQEMNLTERKKLVQFEFISNEGLLNKELSNNNERRIYWNFHGYRCFLHRVFFF